MVLFFLANQAFSQSVQNMAVSFAGEKGTITFDLIGGLPGQSCAVELFSSHNQFSSPLTRVSGDVGSKVPMGAGRKIVWDANELGEFEGEIEFKVRATLLPVPLTLLHQTNVRVRRGKSVSLQWYGTNQGQPISITLIRDQQPPLPLGTVENKTSFIWAVPKKFQKGEVKLQLVSKGETVYSTPIKIIGKTPFVVKLLPVIAVSGILLFVPSRPEAANNDLPAPPSPR